MIVRFHTMRLQSVQSAAPDEDEVAVSDKMSSEKNLFLLLENKYRKKKRTKRRRFWVHPYLQNNHDKRLYLAAKDMDGCNEKC